MMCARHCYLSTSAMNVFVLLLLGAAAGAKIPDYARHQSFPYPLPLKDQRGFNEGFSPDISEISASVHGANYSPTSEASSSFSGGQPIKDGAYSFSLGSGGNIQTQYSSISDNSASSSSGPLPITSSGFTFNLNSENAANSPVDTTVQSQDLPGASYVSIQESGSSSGTPPVIGGAYSFSLGSGAEVQTQYSPISDKAASSSSGSLPVTGSGFAFNLNSENSASSHAETSVQSQDLPVAPTVLIQESGSLSGSAPVIGGAYSFSLGSGLEVQTQYSPISDNSTSSSSGSLPVTGAGSVFKLNSENSASSHAEISVQSQDLPLAPTVLIQESGSLSGSPPVIGGAYSFSLGSGAEVQTQYSPISDNFASSSPGSLPTVSSGFAFNLNSENDANSRVDTSVQFQDIPGAPSVSIQESGSSSGTPPVFGGAYSFSLGSGGIVQTQYSPISDDAASSSSGSLPVTGSISAFNLNSENSASSHAETSVQSQDLPVAPTVLIQESGSSSGSPPVIGGAYSFSLGSGAEVQTQYSPISDNSASSSSGSLPVTGSGFAFNLNSENSASSHAETSVQSQDLPVAPSVSIQEAGISSGMPQIIGGAYSFSLGSGAEVQTQYSPISDNSPSASLGSLPMAGSGFASNLNSENSESSHAEMSVQSLDLPVAPSLSIQESGISSSMPQIIGGAYSFSLGSGDGVQTQYSPISDDAASSSSGSLPVTGSGFAFNLNSENSASSHADTSVQFQDLPVAPPSVSIQESGSSSGTPPVIGGAYSFSLGSAVQSQHSSSSLETVPGDVLNSQSNILVSSGDASSILNSDVIGSGFKIDISSGVETSPAKVNNALVPSAEAIDFSKNPIVVEEDSESSSLNIKASSSLPGSPPLIGGDYKIDLSYDDAALASNSEVKDLSKFPIVVTNGIYPPPSANE